MQLMTNVYTGFEGDSKVKDNAQFSVLRTGIDEVPLAETGKAVSFPSCFLIFNFLICLVRCKCWTLNHELTFENVESEGSLKHWAGNTQEAISCVTMKPQRMSSGGHQFWSLQSIDVIDKILDRHFQHFVPFKKFHSLP